MAPGKKAKSTMSNKGIGVVYDSSPPRKAEKSNQKKRKLSDMLGPQWDKLELQRFYEAYRKYGKTWKKVASVVRSRSIDMVEALYNMNRAYLSLPEGTASVSGLIAMMTDHYNVMDGSGSEKDIEDTAPVARKVQKHPKPKGRLGSKKEISLQRQAINSSDKPLSKKKSRDKLIRENSLQPPSISSNDVYFSLLKKIDGLRMKFPVKKRTPRVYVSSLDDPNKKPRRSVMNGNHDELSNGDLLFGQNASLVHSRPQTLQSLEQLRNSQPSAMEKPKRGEYASDEESMDESLSSYDARFGKLLGGSVDSGSALDDYKKGKKRKQMEYEISEAKMFQNVRDAYKFSNKRPMINQSFVNEGAKFDRSPSLSQKKRSKEHIIEDEYVACDALQALADLSLMMPYHTKEPVENAQESVPVRDNTDDTHAPFDVGLQQTPIPFKKRKSQASKTLLADEVAKSKDSSVQKSAVAEQCKSSAKSPGVSSSNGEHMVETEIAVSSKQVQASCDAITSMRSKSRRKRERASLQKDRNHAPSVFPSNCSSLFQDRVQCLKDKARNCLSSPDVRRWCSYEWFYSAIDYPWFSKRDFVEYLNHVGLGHIPRLTRVEWGVIRSSLGKPRRFSERFLLEERDKLEQYRESVRTHYANLRAGLGDGLPTDLARPLSVGQQVVAVHPKTRELHDGSVLVVDRQNCLIQFDRRNLGVEFVMDIDCMPSNPVENMPESLRRQKMSFGHHYSQSPNLSGTLQLASDENVQNLSPLSRVPSISTEVANVMKVKHVTVNSHTKITGDRSLRILETTQSQDMSQQLQPRKVDVMPIPCLARGFDKKSHSVVNSRGANGVLHSSDSSMFSHEETSSNVVEIVQRSREKAHKMVDVAVKVVSSMKEGEDAYGWIGKAFDASLKTERVASCQIPSSNTVPGGLPPQNAAASCISATSDVQMPSELITSCVATLLIIQTCTERQYPPAEVAQMLDNAVSSLHPSCSQNLSVYREIQMCMGRIKTQILALVPS